MKYIIFTFFLLFAFTGFSQIDDPDNEASTGNRIDRADNSIGRESSSDAGSFRIDREHSVSKKTKTFLGQPDAPSLKPDEKKNDFSMGQKEEYVKRTVDFKPKYTEREGDGYDYSEFSKPQDLGKFYTSGDYVKVSWRDAQVVDGDRVDIIVNDEVVVENVTLLARFHSLKVDLKDGFTKIEFQALNQGESGPNTAEFKVEDEDGKILTHDEWNLTTGTKASLVVIKN